MPHASALVRFGIPALSLGVLALWIALVRRMAGRTSAIRFGLLGAAWLLGSGLVAASGWLAHFGGFPPRFAFLLVPSLGLPIWLGASRLGRQLASAPFGLLVGLQAFRLPLELVMHRAAVEGTMPPQMTYTGSNFDIVTGATALAVGLLAWFGVAPRWLLVAWNALGTLLLIAILGIAVASLPAFAVFGSEPARLNTWIAYFPFVWLPAGLVGAAVLGHALLWRRLLSHGMRGRA